MKSTLLMPRVPCLALVVAVSLATPAVGVSEERLLEIMEMELDRNLSSLQLEDLEKPFFIAYRLRDTDRASASATLGSLSAVNSSSHRQVDINVLVGSHEVAGRDASAQWISRNDPDGDRLRHALWLGTDSAYKGALSSLARRQASLQAQRLQGAAADFSEEEAFTHFAPHSVEVASIEEVKMAAKALSAGFRGHDHIDFSLARSGSAASRVLYVNSEGTRFATSRGRHYVFAYALTRATDGSKIDDFFARIRPNLDEAFNAGEMADGVESVVARLASVRSAEETDRYMGPVLFEGQAVAELLAQTFAPKLVARPLGNALRTSQGRDEDLSDRLGSPIMPDFLSLVDDPTLSEIDGRSLLGHFTVDMDGVAARRKVIVDQGELVALLAGRRPTKEVERSTGNRRLDGGVLPSNLLMEVEGGKSERSMNRMLMRLAKKEKLDHAIVVHRISNPLIRVGVLFESQDVQAALGGQLGTAVEATRVYRDGRREPIRNAALTVQSLRDVTAASKARSMHDIAVAPSLRPPIANPDFVVSFVVPDLLIKDVLVKAPQGHVPHPYPVPHPERQK